MLHDQAAAATGVLVQLAFRCQQVNLHIPVAGPVPSLELLWVRCVESQPSLAEMVQPYVRTKDGELLVIDSMVLWSWSP